MSGPVCRCGRPIGLLRYHSGSNVCEACANAHRDRAVDPLGYPTSHRMHPRQVRLRQLEDRALKARNIDDLTGVVMDLIRMMRSQR